MSETREYTESEEHYLYRIAIHEAGHAVIARRLGIKLSRVEIIAAPADRAFADGTAGRVVSDKNRSVAAYRLFPDGSFRKARPLNERPSFVRKEIIHSMAGRWAELLFLGGYYPESYTVDQSIIDATLAAFPATQKAKAISRSTKPLWYSRRNNVGASAWRAAASATWDFP
jgi:membrane-associated protease RseP (regulator of RpoE activity)